MSRDRQVFCACARCFGRNAASVVDIYRSLCCWSYNYAAEVLPDLLADCVGVRYTVSFELRIMAQRPVHLQPAPPRPRKRADATRAARQGGKMAASPSSELQLSLLEGVQLGESLGDGAYAEVCKASVPCAAKILHKVLTSDPQLTRNSDRFAQECRILYGCFHPNIVRFYGVSSDPETGRTILLMELMNQTLTQLLEFTYRDTPLPYYLQLHLSHDIANGVSYLHSKQILHRDLSSGNVLISSPPNVTAKLSDFGMSILRDAKERFSKLTRCPGTPVYMPPEALHEASSTKTDYRNIDSFQMGVLMLQIATRLYPSPSDSQVRRTTQDSPSGYCFDPVPERVRRSAHLKLLRDVDHPLLDHPILECLEDSEEKRPSARCVLEQLSLLVRDKRYIRDCEREGVTPREAGEREDICEISGETIVSLKEEKDKLRRELLERERERERERHRAEGREREREIERERGRERERERDKERHRAEEREREIGREKERKERERLQQQLQRAEIAYREAEKGKTVEHERVQILENSMAQLQWSLREQSQARAQVEGHLKREFQLEKDRVRQFYEDQIHSLTMQRDELARGNAEMLERANAKQKERNQPVFGQRTQPVMGQSKRSWRPDRKVQLGLPAQTERLQLRQTTSNGSEVDFKDHTFHVFGFNKLVTAGDTSRVEFQLCDPAGNPIAVGNEAPPISAVLVGPDDEPLECAVTARGENISVSFIPPLPGRHSVMVSVGRLRERLVSLCAYPDPAHQPHPQIFIGDLQRPWAVAVNNNREMFVCENAGNRVSVYDISNHPRLKRYLGEVVRPTGVAIDDVSNVYVTSEHRLQKFTGGIAVATVGGDKGGETKQDLYYPSSVTVNSGEVYVADQKNGRIQVFDSELKYVRTVTPGNGGLFHDPCDVAFDEEGRMYVAEYGAGRVQVYSVEGRLLFTIGEKERIKPESLHVVNNFLYVSNFNRNHDSAVAVFRIEDGSYVTSFGGRGHGEGVWSDPRGITSCEGNIYVCGSDDGHVHVVT